MQVINLHFTFCGSGLMYAAMCIQLSESAHKALEQSGVGFKTTQRGQIEIKVSGTIFFR